MELQYQSVMQLNLYMLLFNNSLVFVLHKCKKPDNNAIITVANTGKKITGDCSLKKIKNGLDMGSTSVCYSDSCILTPVFCFFSQR
jgi:hypothetical protein